MGQKASVGASSARADRLGRSEVCWLFDNFIGIAKKELDLSFAEIGSPSAALAAWLACRGSKGPTANVAKLLRVHGGCLGVMRR